MLESRLEWMNKNDHKWRYEEEEHRLRVWENTRIITGAFLSCVEDVAKGFCLGVYVSMDYENDQYSLSISIC